MENSDLKQYALSINETHRICTHEMSGHLHLLRFCVDELLEKNETLGDASEYVLKLAETLEKLESMNRLWKITTRTLEPDHGVNLSDIVEKAESLCVLYHGKFLRDIIFNVTNDFELNPEDCFLLMELIFSLGSLYCQLALDRDINSLNVTVSKIDNDAHLTLQIDASLEGVNQDEVNTILEFGDERDKTLRRHLGVVLFNKRKDILKFEYSDKKIIARICL